MVDNQNIQNLDPNILQPNPLQPRGIIPPNTIMELVDSITEHGILEPLVVAHTPAGYLIIAGERRWRAAKLAHLATIPCMVKEATPESMLEMAIVENIQREDINALERAKAFRRLEDEFHLSHLDIAKRIGKSISYVANTLKLLELPDTLKDGLLTGQITEGHARALQAIKDPRLLIDAYRTILRESGSVRRAEDLARRIKAQYDKEMNIVPKKKSARRNIIHEDTDRMQNDLNQKLGENAKVRLIRSERQTRIIILLSGSPNDTEAQLQKIYQGIVK